MANERQRKPKAPQSNPEYLKTLTTREALAYWLALPTKARNPKNQKGLAALLGVSEERLCQIKREPEFQGEVQEYRKTFFRQFTSNIIESLKTAAEKGNDRAAKLFLQYVEDFKETTRQEQEKTERREFVFMLPPDKMSELKQLIELHRQEEGQKYIEAEIIKELPPCENTPPDKT